MTEIGSQIHHLVQTLKCLSARYNDKVLPNQSIALGNISRQMINVWVLEAEMIEQR
jgi:hypothetical protein